MSFYCMCTKIKSNLIWISEYRVQIIEFLLQAY